MDLFELFSEDDDGGGMMNSLRQKVLDLLTPLSANGVPYLTIQQLVDKLGQQRSGLSITRDLIYDLLDPDKVKLVKSVEGDRIYLQLPTSVNSDKEKKRKEDQVKDQERQSRQTERDSMKQTAAENKPVTPPAPKQGGPLAGA